MQIISILLLRMWVCDVQAVHDAIVLPHAADTLFCTIGQRVRLNDAALQRLRRRGLRALHNLGPQTIGEVVATGGKGRVRVKGESEQLCWHDVVNLVRCSFLFQRCNERILRFELLCDHHYSSLNPCRSDSAVALLAAVLPT